jgi:hypothetical protein
MLRPLLLASAFGLALCACDAYKASLLRPPSAAHPRDAGAGGLGDAATVGGKPGDAATGACIAQPEVCNRVDDDCDGKTDEDALSACEGVILNAESDCVPIGKTATCVLLQCRSGYDDCDGNPANGCEPYCMCHDCDDSGSDAGSEPDAN